MKRPFFRYAILILCVLVAHATLAQDRTRKVTQSYSVDQSVKLRVDNRHGLIEIENWDKSEIWVEVTIKASANAFDRIKIDYDERVVGNTVSFETEFRGGIRGKSNLDIDYRIKMPRANPIDITHRHGDLYIDDRDGDLEVELAHGNHKIEDVKGESYLKLSFSRGEIGNLTRSEVDIQHSNTSIESATELELEAQHSTVELGDIEILDIESRHGKLGIESVSQIEGDLSFTSSEIGQLMKSLRLETTHVGKFEIDKVSKDFELIDIETSFGPYDITFEKGSGGTINGKFEHGRLKYDDSDFEFSYVNREQSRSEYKGKFGSGGSGKVILTARHASIYLELDY